MTLSVVSFLYTDELNVNVHHWCHVTNRWNRCIRVTKSANVSSSTTIFTWIGVESKPNLGAEKPAYDHLNHDMAEKGTELCTDLEVFQDSTA